jgi:hypothetical protein
MLTLQYTLKAPLYLPFYILDLYPIKASLLGYLAFKIISKLFKKLYLILKLKGTTIKELPIISITLLYSICFSTLEVN